MSNENVQKPDQTNLNAQSAANDNDPTFAEDLLRGAESVAEWLLGGRTKKMRRKIFHLHATSNIPTFKIGGMICARKSRLTQWIIDQETRRAANNPGKKA